MRSKTVPIMVLVLALSIPLMAGGAMAVDFHGQMYIEVGGYHAVPFTAEDAGIYRYMVDSVDGQSVAVLVMDTANFNLYASNQSFEYEDYTVAVTESRQIALLRGNYYFVIDNSDRVAPAPVSGVQVEYSMQEEFPLSDLFQNLLTIGLISVAIIAVVIVVLLVYLRKDERRRRESMQPSRTGTKYCMHCGREIPTDTIVCPYCGGRN